MSEQHLTTCLTCGGNLEVNHKGILECPYCHREYKGEVGEFYTELQEIVRRRKLREFAQAEELCAELIIKRPDCAEAYWQRLLAAFGVVYVKGENDKDSKPTFFCHSYDKGEQVQDKEDYRKVMENSSGEEKKNYIRWAEELDKTLKNFFELVDKEHACDIFISFKKTEEITYDDGSKGKQETDDCAKGWEIYNALKDKYAVFFSPVSIEGDSEIEGSKYEPRILKALQTAQVMILIGSKEKYLTAPWVENEWRRYQYFVDKGKKAKNSLVLLYQKNIPKLPHALGDIQLPNVDMFKSTYLDTLKEKIKYVKSSKGYKSKIGNKQIQESFVASAFNSTDAIKRETIGAKGRGKNIPIPATENREMEMAKNFLTNGDKKGNFENAILKYTAIIRNRENNADAYWGRFCAQLKIKNDFNIATGIALSPDSVFENTAIFEDLKKAIEYSNDDKKTRERINRLIELLSPTAVGAMGKKNNGLLPWYKLRPIYDAIIVYLDDEQMNRVLNLLAEQYGKYIQKKVSVCEDIVAHARKIFLAEKELLNLNFLRTYAIKLYQYKYYKQARAYFEELAGVSQRATDYLHILKCRVKTQNLGREIFKLKVNTEDDSTVKKPAELDLDEIIERVILRNKIDKNKEIDKELMDMLYFQIMYNKSNAKVFIETFVSCYKHCYGEGNQVNKLITLLRDIADRYILTKDFKTAKVYYNEILSIDPRHSKAHWGLLKCRLKAFDDRDIAVKSKSLLKIPEYNNATNCADNAEFSHYTAVYNRESSVMENDTIRRKHRTYKFQKGGSKVTAFAFLLLFSVLMLASLFMKDYLGICINVVAVAFMMIFFSKLRYIRYPHATFAYVSVIFLALLSLAYYVYVFLYRDIVMYNQVLVSGMGETGKLSAEFLEKLLGGVELYIYIALGISLVFVCWGIFGGERKLCAVLTPLITVGGLNLFLTIVNVLLKPDRISVAFSTGDNPISLFYVCLAFLAMIAYDAILIPILLKIQRANYE